MQADNGIRVDLTPTANAGEVTDRPPRIVASLVTDDDAPADEDLGNPAKTTPDEWPEGYTPAPGGDTA